jgi:prepilin-type N-terminal cleavage/methylation domain-containing protein
VEYGKQRGFTLLELLVVLAILGFLSAAMAMTFSVVTMTSTMAAGQNMALSQVNLAGNWITRDVRGAFGTVNNTTGNTLCAMQCYVWNGTTFSTDNVTITYTINNGILKRTSQVTGNSASENDIARFIVGPTPGTTYFVSENSSTKYYKLTVKADYNGSNFEKIYKIKQVITQ